MVRGDVVVDGHVKEREAAKKQYQAAVRAGKVASLLEVRRVGWRVGFEVLAFPCCFSLQEDLSSGDIFEASVGNIPPGDTVRLVATATTCSRLTVHVSRRCTSR